MYLNAYEIELEKADGTTVTAALRLNIAKQMELKKKYKESTTQTLFGAIDDAEKFVEVLDACLNWAGNQNTIKKGTELADLMAANDLLGLMEKQKLITSIGRYSGIFSEKEKDAIDKSAEKRIGRLLGDDLDGEGFEEEEESKNA